MAKITNAEQMSVHPKFKTICKNIMHDWNSSHKDQIKEQNQELTLQRLTLSIEKLMERQDIYNMLVNAQINLKEW